MGAQVPVTAVRAVTGPLAVVLLVLLAGCGSASDTGSTASDTGATASGMPSTSPPAQPSPSPAPRRLTPEADGNHYSMAMGSTTALVVREPGADEPEVDGASVILIPVVHVTGSGVREWEVRAVEPGTSVITSTTPAYTITLTVQASSGTP